MIRNILFRFSSRYVAAAALLIMSNNLIAREYDRCQTLAREYDRLRLIPVLPMDFTASKDVVQENEPLADEQLDQLSLHISNYEDAFQFASTISVNAIEMANTSVWQYDPAAQEEVRNWRIGEDRLVIMQNTSWFFGRSFNFRIYNERTRTAVNCNIFLNPYTDSVRKILFIDAYNRIITLDDGSRWSISSSDDSIYSDHASGNPLYRHWISRREVESRGGDGDLIIIGANNEYFSSFMNPFILINTNLDGKFVRAKYLDRGWR